MATDTQATEKPVETPVTIPPRLTSKEPLTARQQLICELDACRERLANAGYLADRENERVEARLRRQFQMGI